MFVDTLNMAAIRKKIRHLDRQEPNESRRLWADVTKALQNKDEEAATDAKHIVCICIIKWLTLIVIIVVFSILA